MRVIFLIFLISASIRAQVFHVTGISPLFETRILSKALAIQDGLNQIIEKNNLHMQTSTVLKNGLIESYQLRIQSKISLKILKINCVVQHKKMICKILAKKSLDSLKKHKTKYEQILPCRKNRKLKLCFTYKFISNIGNFKKIHFSVNDLYERNLFRDEIITFSSEENEIHQQINKKLNSRNIINRLKKRLHIIKVKNKINNNQKNYIGLHGLEVFEYKGTTYIELPSFITKNISQYSDK